MRVLGKPMVRALTTGAVAAALVGLTGSVQAKNITIRIASGHPPTVVYAGLMKNYLQPELKKAIESRTSHTVKCMRM